MMRRHLDDRTLDAYVAGPLDEAARERVKAHLAGCGRCRTAVQRQRELSALAATWPSQPAPRTELLEGALRRRAAGERTMLPTEPVPATASGAGPVRRHAWGSMAAAAALVVMIGAAALLMDTPQASASASELQLHPASPAPGERVSVVYRPALELGGADHLVLRAHLRTPGSAEHATEDLYYQPDFRYVSVAQLQRRPDGTFHGSFELPKDVVFATLAVETPDGAAVDANNGTFWRVVVRSADGRPSLEGLVQWAVAYTGENSLLVLEAGRSLREHYPGRPIGWMMEIAGETWTAGSGAAALKDEWRRRSEELHRKHRDDPELSGDDMSAMIMLASDLGEDGPAAKEHWKARLIAERPGHGLAIMYQYADAAGNTTDRRARLDELERIWRAGERDTSQDPTREGPLSLDARIDAAATGIALSRDVGTAEEQRLWLARLAGLGPEVRTQTALRLLRSPALVDEAERRLRAVIAALEEPDDGRRRPGRTRAEQQALDRRDQAYRRADLGRLLLREERVAEAMVELERAAELAQTMTTLRPLVDARLTLGDTAAAVEAWARLLADPQLETAARLDTVRLRSGSHYDASAFAAAVHEAREARIRAALREGRPRRVASSIVLTEGATGAETTWAAVHGGVETVVVFWSRFCTPAMNSLPQIHQRADAMAAEGVRTILVTQEAHAPGFTEFVERERIQLPIYHDARGELSRVLGNNGTPKSYLTDRQGLARWRPAQPYSLELQLRALRAEAAGLAAGRD